MEKPGANWAILDRLRLLLGTVISLPTAPTTRDEFARCPELARLHREYLGREAESLYRILMWRYINPDAYEADAPPLIMGDIRKSGRRRRRNHHTRQGD